VDVVGVFSEVTGVYGVTGARLSDEMVLSCGGSIGGKPCDEARSGVVICSGADGIGLLVKNDDVGDDGVASTDACVGSGSAALFVNIEGEGSGIGVWLLGSVFPKSEGASFTGDEVRPPMFVSKGVDCGVCIIGSGSEGAADIMGFGAVSVVVSP
jgi:hypothetical protein